MFELNGVKLTLEQLQNHAKEKGYDFNQYMNNMRAAGLVELDKNIGRSPTKTFETFTNVLKAIPQIVTDSEERAELAKYMKNRIDNIPESFQTALISSQAAARDLFTADLDNLGYNEKQKEIREKAEKIILEKYNKLDELEFKDTGKGIVAGAKEGDAASLIAGVFGAGVSMAETAIPAFLTFGASLPIQVAAPMYTEYNKAKAKQLYGDDPNAIEQLVQNDQTEIAVPMALGAIATGLEYVGLKGVTKYIQSIPGKGAKLAKLTWVSSGEGFTEVGQLGVEKLNSGLGGGKSIEEASADAWDAMTSDEGLEMWFNGFLGAAQMSAGGRAINRALRNDNASIKDINDKINNLAKLNNQKYNTRNKDVKESIDLEIKEAEKDFKNYLNNKRKLANVLTNEEKNSLISILNEKDNVKSKAESLKSQLEAGNISSKEFGYAIRGLNNQDKKLSNQLADIQSSAVGRAAEQTTETVKTFIKEGDLQGKVTEMTSDEISNIKEEGFDSKEAANQFGFIRQSTDGSFEIVLNKDKPMVGTAAHEFMHAVLFKTLGNNQELQDNLGNALIEHTAKLGGETSMLSRRLMAYGKYNKEGVFERDANFGEETITIMSEEIINGNLKFNETFFTKIGDIIRRFSQNYLGKEITFDTGRDVYNFVKDYSKSIKEGKINKAILKVAKEGAEGKLIPKKADPKAATQMSKEASDNVQRIYDNVGEKGAMDIIAQFKPIVNKIVDKRRDAPNFDRQLLTDEIETGKRGIFDLIREYDPKSGVPLAAYINKFLPARAIEASKRVLGEEFTQDVTEKVDIAAEEVTTEVKAKPKPKKIVLADRLGITDKVSKAINKIIPSLDIDKLTFKTLKNKVPEIVGDLFGIAPKKLITNANITKGELQKSQMFISKNADLLINMLPEGATTSGTATGIPNSLLKAFYTKTERAKMAKTGSKAGLAVQQKNDINRKQFLEVFGIVDGKPNRNDRNTSARVLALANTLGKMITNQAVRSELAKTKANEKAISKIAEGKSISMFSKDANTFNIDGTIDNLLSIHADKVGRKTFKLRTEQDVDLYIEALINDVLPLMPRNFWFGKEEGISDTGSEFTPSDRVIDIPKSKKQQRKDLYVYYKQQINALNQLPDEAFGKDIGVTDFSRPSYSSLFEGKKGVQVDKIKETNQRTAKIHEALWSRIYEAIQKNPTKAAAIGNYFKLVSKQNNHWHRAAAEIIGYSINPKGTAKKLYEYEHAMPASASYLYLIDGALKGYDFKSIYKPVMDNFKLIALDAAENKKLNDAGLADRMPEGWNTTDNKWWERYFNDIVDIDPNSIVGLDGKTFSKTYSIPQLKPKTKYNKTLVNAALKARTTSYSKESKGITVLDFDDTLATTESLVKYTAPDGETGTLNAEQFASTYQDLQDQGYTFDFSDFNRVVKGKLAPLFNKALKLQKKFGSENMFVLTARPPAAQQAIFDFLKANGLNIPLKNITGLGNSTSEAKALWMADKVSEGYNDFYFADDALQNVQAVKNMLDQFDVKSKIQQAKIKFSKDMDGEFNKILQDVTGIESKKRYSQTKARKRGEGKGKFRFFVPPSHEDFAGLLYNFMGKGEKGNKHREFFEKALLKPLNRAYQELTAAKQAIATDYKNLIKQFPDLRKKLTKKTPDGDYYYSDAVRVYLWDKAGFEIPGTSKTDVKELSDLVKNDPELQAFADTIGKISRMDEGYIEPGEHWEAGDIRTDLADATGRVGRAKFFNEFQENADIIFNQENLNKIEAAYGADFKEALKDILYRTKNGTNRTVGPNKIVNGFLDYLNGSIGATMFFNARSAVLQTLSTVNFINFGDNNIFKASAAFANQPQFWKDFSMIFNSDVLKQRRAGVAFDINANEIASAVGKSKTAAGKVRAAVKYLLQIGFLPTQMADSFAISLGGASMYRNRVNTYKSQSLSQKEAEAKAFTDFQEVSEATQQSARPDMISQQQASVLGRLILAFQNTPSQYVRLIKKAGLDLINRRKSKPYTSQVKSDMSNISRIIYYGAVQNIIFGALQTALFAMLFSEDDEEDEKTQKFFKSKRDRVINGTIDTILRGSGVAGAIVATIKNGLIKYHENQDKKWNKQLDTISEELIQLSPPIGIKKRKLDGFEKSLEFNKKVIPEMDTFDLDNPIWGAYAQLIEGATNIPVARLHRKVENVRAALNSENEWWQRLAVGLGWSKWDVGIENKEVEAVKEKIKKQKKENKKKKKEFGIKRQEILF